MTSKYSRRRYRSASSLVASLCDTTHLLRPASGAADSCSKRERLARMTGRSASEASLAQTKSAPACAR
uniref:Si605032f04 n=1 Tax=Arundo donax TaxID=35708 RepID=A0A0A9VJS9_ARUDO